MRETPVSSWTSSHEPYSMTPMVCSSSKCVGSPGEIRTPVDGYPPFGVQSPSMTGSSFSTLASPLHHRATEPPGSARAPISLLKTHPGFTWYQQAPERYQSKIPASNPGTAQSVPKPVPQQRRENYFLLVTQECSLEGFRSSRIVQNTPTSAICRGCSIKHLQREENAP